MPAPADLGTEVVGVPEGSELRLAARMESVLDGVLVTGTVRGRARGECVRCLDEVGLDVEAEVQELYVYPEHVLGGEDDDGVSELQGDLIDLEPALRDAVVLALPFQPVCRPDCPGLCPECGKHLAEDPGHRHDGTDARWQALADLVLPEDAPPKT